MSSAHRTWMPVAVWTAALAACAGTFALYLNPHFALDLATRVWACF